MPAPTLTQFRCLGCTHRWFQIEDGLALVCPGCELGALTGELAAAQFTEAGEADQAAGRLPLAA
jgi:hypothetical protein